MTEQNLNVNSEYAQAIQGNVARLLAKENVIVHRSPTYRTACFNIESRVMEVPIFKSATKEVYDLFIGHEIGHALWTSEENLNDFRSKIGENRHSLYNILEDIRIEKLSQQEYPGLIRSFQMGYKHLKDQGFFGSTPATKFIDKLNIVAKLGSLANDVAFDEDEMEVAKKALSIRTHEELIDVAREIVKFVAEQKQKKESAEEQDEKLVSKDEKNQPAPADEDENSSNEFEDQSEASATEPQDQEESAEDNSQSEGIDADDESDKTGSDDGASNEGANNSEANEEKEEDPSLDDELTSDTQDTFDHSLENDIDTSSQYFEFIEPSTKQILNSINTYSEIFAARDSHALSVGGAKIEPNVEMRKSIKKIVNHMRNEFERKKAALEYVHGRESRVGKIDVNMLHRYKTEDDIFLSITEKAQSKSHGIFMLLDFSGSMQCDIANVIKQAIILADFCRLSGLPFEVYSFTSGGKVKPSLARNELKNAEIDLSNLKMNQLLSSTMKKKDYDRSVDELCGMCKNGYYNAATRVDALGGTPLNEALVASTYLLKEFKKKNNIQIPSFFLLSDGEGECLCYQGRNYFTYAQKYCGKLFSNKMIEYSSGRATCTVDLLKNIKQALNANTFWYYMVNGAPDVRRQSYIVRADKKEISRAIRKESLSVHPRKRGVDKYIIMEGGSHLALEEDLQIQTGAEKDIQKSFIAGLKKNSHSKVFVREVVDGISKLI